MAIKIINLVLRILLGATFILSALLKLYPIELFEFNFVNIGVANWQTAPFIARLLIAFEFTLGLMLLFNILLPKFTLKATLLLLAFFSVYLCVQILLQGNSGNCGCFGTYLQMTPLESIAKNIVMIGMAWWLFVSGEQLTLLPSRFRLWDKYAVIVVAVLSTVTPFILNPVDFNPPKQYDKSSVGYSLDLTTLYAGKEKPDVDLRKGRHILSLLSLTCPHCRVAAFKMHVMHQRHPEIPFYFLLRGNKEKYLNDFYTNTSARDIDNMIYNTDDFLVLAGGEVPSIFWLENGKVVNRSNLYTLNEDELLKWIKK